MHNKYILLSARTISAIFSPYYMPVMAFVVLLFFSYLSYTSWAYRLHVLLLVYAFTVVFPRLGIYIYRRVNGWARHEIGSRERRVLPYLISILSFTMLLWIMERGRMPLFTQGIIMASLLIQLICSLLNNWFKVSTHAAASGGVVGALIAFSVIFGFDPTVPLCFAILLSGAVCTARLILRQHTLAQVGVGTLVGFVCALFCILRIGIVSAAA